MKCRLCGGCGNLCKSHIVPEFVYQPLYDSDHRFIEVSDIANGVVRNGQRGHWDRLLCQDCESSINCYEKHARRLFTDPLPGLEPGSAEVRIHRRLRYDRTKLFVLSILWRASVSARPIHRHVSLGPRENRIRDMLLNADPGKASAYPTLIFVLNGGRVHFRAFMVEPTHMRIDWRKCYRLVIGGFVALIFVSSSPAPGPFPRLVLSPHDPVKTHDVEFADFRFLRECWKRAAMTTRDVEI